MDRGTAGRRSRCWRSRPTRRHAQAEAGWAGPDRGRRPGRATARCGACARAADARRTGRRWTSAGRTAPPTGAAARAASSRANTRWGCCCCGPVASRRCPGPSPRRTGPGSGCVPGASAPAGRPTRRPRAAAGRGAARRAPADREAARRRARRRADAVAAGAVELEQRLVDLLSGGLAGAEQAAGPAWEEAAARMVDAQAPGLASRVRELGTVAGSGPGWPERLLSECALLHLLAQGYLGRDDLPAPLAATVRARVGFSVDSASVLADEAATTAGRLAGAGPVRPGGGTAHGAPRLAAGPGLRAARAAPLVRRARQTAAARAAGGRPA